MDHATNHPVVIRGGLTLTNRATLDRAGPAGPGRPATGAERRTLPDRTVVPTNDRADEAAERGSTHEWESEGGALAGHRAAGRGEQVEQPSRQVLLHQSRKAQHLRL